MSPPVEGRGPTPAGRAMIRRVQVAVYLAFSLGIFAYARLETQEQGRLVVLTYLLGFYMAARALAVWIKFRQDSARARYSDEYASARDLFPGDEDDAAEDGAGKPVPEDKPHG